MVIYSSKGERLAEHSFLVLRLYHGMFGPRHERLVANRLGVDLTFVSEAMRTACLLHDVGKALKKFQEGVKEGKGFKFHEVVSALFTYNTLRNALSGADVLIKHCLSFAAAYAVLQHHQAMRDLQEVFSEGLKSLPLDGGIDDNVVNEIAMAAQMAVHLFDASKVLEAFKEEVEKVPKEGLSVKLQELVSDFNEIMASGHPRGMPSSWAGRWAAAWAKLQSALPLFVAPLQLSDYLAAFIVRGGRYRRLHREALLLLRRMPRQSPY